MEKYSMKPGCPMSSPQNVQGVQNDQGMNPMQGHGMMCCCHMMQQGMMGNHMMCPMMQHMMMGGNNMMCPMMQQNMMPMMNMTGMMPMTPMDSEDDE